MEGVNRSVAAACLTVGFLAVLAAFVFLSMSGQDSAGLIGFVATILGLLGLGAHQRAQGKTLAKIDRQTNGVLDQRIRDGVTAALAALEHKSSPAPAAPTPTPAATPAAPPAGGVVSAPSD